MHVNIHFTTDTPAFDHTFINETARALRNARAAVLDSENTTEIRRPIKDKDGKRIGMVHVSRDTPLDLL
jgi:hypothetical protein